MEIPKEAYEPFSLSFRRQENFETRIDATVKAAIIGLLRELDNRGVEFDADYSLTDLAEEVEAAPTGYLLWEPESDHDADV